MSHAPAAYNMVCVCARAHMRVCKEKLSISSTQGFDANVVFSVKQSSCLVPGEGDTVEQWFAMHIVQKPKHERDFSAASPLCSHGRLPPYDRRGVRYEDNRGERPEDQAADLGHGRTGALQGRDPLLLPRRRGGADGVRHHQVRGAFVGGFTV